MAIRLFGLRALVMRVATALLVSSLGFIAVRWRRFLDNGNLASAGSDLVLIDRVVVDAVIKHREANLSIFAILAWLVFGKEIIFYTKEARKYGSSGWTLKRKIKLFIDSVTAFSYFPIRFMSMFGCIVALIGCIYAGVVIIDFAYRIAGGRVDIPHGCCFDDGRFANGYARRSRRICVAQSG